MKRLGKNKKKQWRHCYKVLEHQIDAAQKHKKIIHEDFTEKTKNKRLDKILKGNKESAKILQDIPTASDGRLRVPRKDVPKIKKTCIDLWDQGSVSPVKSICSRYTVPSAGQSYNPSIEDHLALISMLGSLEEKKKKQESKTERFFEALRNAKPTPDPLVEARKFLNTLNSKSDVPPETNLPVVEDTVIKKKIKKVDIKKRVAVELNNIPKLLKEIKRENKAAQLKKVRLKEKKICHTLLKNTDFNVPFQLPNEIVPCLRKLSPEGDLMREIERRRNKCPRARRTLQKKAKTTNYERKR